MPTSKELQDEIERLGDSLFPGVSGKIFLSTFMKNRLHLYKNIEECDLSELVQLRDALKESKSEMVEFDRSRTERENSALYQWLARRFKGVSPGNLVLMYSILNGLALVLVVTLGVKFFIWASRLTNG